MLREVREPPVADDILDEVRFREDVARPALVRAVAGFATVPELKLQRNVALHADRVPDPSEGAAAFRKAERGPRLDVRSRPHVGAFPLHEAQAVPSGRGGT